MPEKVYGRAKNPVIAKQIAQQLDGLAQGGKPGTGSYLRPRRCIR